MDTTWRAMGEAARAILWEYWANSRWIILLIVSISVVSSIAAVAAPYLFSKLVDQLAAGGAIETSILGFMLYALLLGVAVMLEDTVPYLSLISARNLELLVATSFFDKILKKTVDFFIQYNPAEIQNAQQNGEEAMNDVADLFFGVFIPGFVQLALSLVLLGTMISSEIVLIVVIYGIFVVALTCYANLATRVHLDSAVNATQENAKFVGNAMNAMETLRHLGSDRWMRERFSESVNEVRDSWIRFCKARVAYNGLYGAALAFEFAVTFALLLPAYKAGTLTIGNVVLFNMLLLQMNHPFETIGRSINQMVRAHAQFLPFVKIWTAPEEPDSAPTGGFTLTEGKLSFEGVGFSYDGEHGVEQVSFVADRGRITFLIGETGAGKSTLMKLALKSLEPRAGRITVDGIDLAQISRAEWYSMIGIVPQEVMLVSNTLKTNIVLGRQFDESRLRKAAEKAAILNFVESLPDGFETTIGERGLRLSGGERQRIAIARALYAEPGILLLDEASSALDEATERDILAQLRLIANVTILAITHRERIIEPGDRIVRIRDGCVEAEPDGSAGDRSLVAGRQ
jgi:ABC-type bacteriocin/lantibiotic exporter with double-glycine peptidase domain